MYPTCFESPKLALCAAWTCPFQNGEWQSHRTRSKTLRVPTSFETLWLARLFFTVVCGALCTEKTTGSAWAMKAPGRVKFVMACPGNFGVNQSRRAGGDQYSNSKGKLSRKKHSTTKQWLFRPQLMALKRLIWENSGIVLAERQFAQECAISNPWVSVRTIQM